MAQAIASAYFEEVGIEGLKAHSHEISQFYRKQRDLIVTALDKHMKDLGSWIVPEVNNNPSYELSDSEFRHFLILN